jgi:hypothetical protein
MLVLVGHVSAAQTNIDSLLIYRPDSPCRSMMKWPGSSLLQQLGDPSSAINPKCNQLVPRKQPQTQDDSPPSVEVRVRIGGKEFRIGFQNPMAAAQLFDWLQFLRGAKTSIYPSQRLALPAPEIPLFPLAAQQLRNWDPRLELFVRDRLACPKAVPLSKYCEDLLQLILLQFNPLEREKLVWTADQDIIDIVKLIQLVQENGSTLKEECAIGKCQRLTSRIIENFDPDLLAQPIAFHIVSQNVLIGAELFSGECCQRMIAEIGGTDTTVLYLKLLDFYVINQVAEEIQEKCYHIQQCGVQIPTEHQLSCPIVMLIDKEEMQTDSSEHFIELAEKFQPEPGE